MTDGQQATADGDLDAVEAAVDAVIRQITITYLQATIRYAAQMEDALANGDAASARIQQAEGWSFWRVIEPLVAAVAADSADTITSMYDLAAQPSSAAAAVLSAVERAYPALGIDPAEVGTLH